jgi:hypothetical protein
MVLPQLGYREVRSVETEYGHWQIFARTKLLTAEQMQHIEIQMFFAVYRHRTSGRVFPVAGEFSDINALISNLISISSNLLKEQSPSSFLRIPLSLSEENAQDYGYVRGLILGILLMGMDLLFSIWFRIRPFGVITSILEYTRLVYFGTPGFGIFFGMVAIGIYFTVLFIALPILFGSFYRWKASRIRRFEESKVPDEALIYDYGAGAVTFIDDQYKVLVDDVRKNAMYQEVSSRWPLLDRESFENLYNQLCGGFCTPESLLEALNNIEQCSKDFRLSEFLGIMVAMLKRTPRVNLSISDSEEK